MPTQQLKKLLDDQGIKYVSITHSRAYTTQEIAEITHISAKEFAKTVVVNADGKLLMVIIPGHRKVDLDKVKVATKAKKITLASEFEFAQSFPGCELGAMPPFGNLFDMPVYVDKRLTQDEYIAFNAGTHAELIKLKFSDYKKLVKPTVVEL